MLNSGCLTIVNRPVPVLDPLVDLGGSALFGPGSGVTAEALREAGYSGPLRQRGVFLQIGEEPRDLPLLGRRIVVTREADQGKEFRSALSELGATVLNLPVLAFEGLDWTLDPSGFDWIIFTSANGVRFFFEGLRRQGGDVRQLGRQRLAAIGPATARALEQIYLRVDLIPPAYVAESLLEVFPDVQGQRILLARAEEAREVLPEGLRARGAEVEVLSVYRTVLPATAPRLAEADLLTFTSSSTVKHFCRLTREHFQVPALCIGPVTAETAREAGFSVLHQADTFTTEGMIAKMLELFQESFTGLPYP